MIKLIYASDIKGVIGLDNKLPWHLPSDLKRFKELTEGHTVVMGRKTYLSLPDFARPLPKRSNVVLTNNKDFVVPDNVTLINNLSDYLSKVDSDKDIWIIGGESVYKQAIAYVQEVYHTKIYMNVKGDSFFNIDSYKEFKLIQSTRFQLDEDNKLMYSLDIYKKL